MRSIKHFFLTKINDLLLGKIDDIYHEIVCNPYNLTTEKYLQKILKFSSEKNYFYSQYLRKSLSLKELPVLTKESIRNNFVKIQSIEKGPGVYRNSSGGSTGIPLLFFQDQVYKKWLRATERFYFRNFLGVEQDTVKNVILWGSERDTLKQNNIVGKVYNFFTNTIFLNTFSVNANRWHEFTEIINKQKPYYIKGYAGSLYQIAKYIKINNLKIHRPKFIYSSAELLRNFMRKEIEEVFRTKVYDFYGSREVGAIAGECAKGKKHIFTFNNFVEVFKPNTDSPERDEGIGRIIISNLHNYTMPLLRYEIGDMGSISYEKCSCGSNLPWFKNITGRVTDHFINKGGTLIHGEFFTHLFYYRDWVNRFQVNQLEPGVVEILVVKSKKPIINDDKIDINEKIRKVMGKNCVIRWKIVDTIPLTSQGKFLFIRCLLRKK